MSKNGLAPSTGEDIVSYSFLMEVVRYIQGRVFTVVDAMYSDEVQRKAVKEIMREAFESAWSMQGEVLSFHDGYLYKGRIEDGLPVITKEKADMPASGTPSRRR